MRSWYVVMSCVLRLESGTFTEAPLEVFGLVDTDGNNSLSQKESPSAAEKCWTCAQESETLHLRKMSTIIKNQQESTYVNICYNFCLKEACTLQIWAAAQPSCRENCSCILLLCQEFSIFIQNFIHGLSCAFGLSISSSGAKARSPHRFRSFVIFLLQKKGRFIAWNLELRWDNTNW